MNTIMRSSRKPIIPRNPDKNEIGGEGRLIKKRKEFLHGKYRDYRIFFQKKRREESQLSTFWNNVNRAEDIQYA